MRQTTLIQIKSSVWRSLWAARIARRLARPKLEKAIDETREILGVPDDYRIGIVPASDTGAFEMAMWSLLGERPVEMVAWESFGAGWVTDVAQQLKIEHSVHTAQYGEIVDMAELNYDNDVCFHLEWHNIWRAPTRRKCDPR